jgi:thioredoxin-related protein
MNTMKIMMKRQLIFVLLTLVCLAAEAEPPAGYPFLAFDEAMREAEQQGKPLFVYFGRYGCGYCDKTNAEAFSDATVKQRFTEHYILAYVDSESGKRMRLPTGERITERELGTRYDAFVTPVFSFITVNGNVLARLVGVQRVVDFLDADKQVQDKLGAKGS